MKKTESHEITLEDGNMKVIYYRSERKTQIRVQNLGSEYNGELYMSSEDIASLSAILNELVVV